MQPSHTDTEIQTIAIDIGEQLRQTRQNRKLSLSEAASCTKLHETALRALEDNAFNRIGAAVYVRGYLKLYAQFLDLDAKAIMEAFDHQVNLPETLINPYVAGANHVHAPNKKRRPILVAAFWVSLFVGGLALLYIFKIEPTIIQFSKEHTPPTEQNLTLTESSPPPPTVMETTPITGSTDQITTLSLSNQTARIVEETEKLLSNTESSHATLSLESATTQEHTSETQVESIIQPAEEVENQPTSPLEDPSIALRFTANNWVMMRAADGRKLAEKTFKANETYTVKHSDLPLTLKTNNPKRIIATSSNGEVLSLNKLSSKTYRLNLPTIDAPAISQ